MGRDDDLVQSFRTDYPAEERAKLRQFSQDATRAATEPAGAFEKFSGSITGTTAKFAIWHTAISQVAGTVGRLFSAVGEFAERGGVVNDLLGNLGVSTDAADRALGGLVSRVDLARLANEAMQRGLNLNEKQFGDLANAAGLLSDKLGTDVASQFNAVTDAVTMASPRTLKLFNIHLDLTKVYGDFARQIGTVAKELTEAEQVTARQNAVMEEFRKLSETTKFQVQGLGDEFGRASTAWTNFVDSLAQRADSMTFLSDAMRGLNFSLYTMGELFQTAIPAEQYEARMAQIRAATHAQKVAAEDAALAQAGFVKRIRETAEGGTITEIVFAPKRRAARARPEGAKGKDVEFAFEESQKLFEAMQSRRLAANVAYVEQQRETGEVLRGVYEANLAVQQRFADQEAALFEHRTSTVRAAGDAMAQALGESIAASLVEGASFGVALHRITATVLKNLAAQSFVEAIFETAKGFKALAVGSPTAALHFKSAALFAAVGVAAGAVGRAVTGGGAISSIGADNRPSDEKGKTSAGAGREMGFGTERGEAKVTYIFNISGVAASNAAEFARVVTQALEEGRNAGVVPTRTIGGHEVVVMRG